MNESVTTAKSGERFLALDALRGLAILLMLLVNTFGISPATPAQLRHASWHESIHIADMAFPWFLLCVGVAIPFSAASFRNKGVPEWRYDLRVVRRTIILLALGALLDSVGDVKLTLFSVGVLQTIAISYFFGVLLYDLPIHRRMTLAAMCLIGYWAAIKFIPVPGVGPGVINEQHNLIRHINSTYLGQVGLWNLPRIIPTTALVLIGTGIGDLVRVNADQRWEAKWLLGLGVALVFGGLLWSISVPINKWVWTPSFILFSGGAGTIVMGLFHIAMDMKGLRKWGFPLIVFGSNAILAYVLPVLTKSLILNVFHVELSRWPSVILFTAFWWVILWVLYRRRIFLKV